MHSVPGVHGLDLQDDPPDRRGARPQGRSRHHPRRGQARRRDDDLRLLRRRGRPVHLLHREVPWRVRGDGPPIAMPRLTVNGQAIEVPAGTNLIEAARVAGVEVPHYCYHLGLSIAGQCRLCMVDIEKAPRPTIACNTVAADGMVVSTETDRVRETRKSIMEFHLINHPLDCPVCDQAGECGLQIYYMKHGLYDPRMTDEKVHKPKAVPLGPHVILDAERCILCSRCVRFCDEITGTGELGIFERGDLSEIGLFPGKELDNKYSGNLVDICPVGALTDRDFRFQVRVWYLETAKSVCPGCARGCNVEVHVNRRRPHHAEGRRVARLKPRFNADVNRWWICDAGRYGFGFVDANGRLLAPTRRDGETTSEATWDEAIAAVAAALRRLSPDEVGVIASPRMSNEDLAAVQMVIFTGTNANRTSGRAHWVLPAGAWVERDGTYTNFEGRVQRFRQAVEPLGQALAAWDMLGRILAALGEAPAATRAEHWFRRLAATGPAFARLSYPSLGDTGRMGAPGVSASS